MIKDLTKYHNDLNAVVMRSWTSEEMNFFFAIITKARDKGCETLFFEAAELKEFIQFADRRKQRWEDVIKNTAKKVGQLVYWEETAEEFTVMTLFKEFRVNLKEKTVMVKVSDNFEYILNRFEAQFTVYEYEEFRRLRSTYAKTMYRLLKQWRTKGKREFKTEEFKRILGIPDVYKPTHIDSRVLKPISKELESCFNNLKINKIKSKKRGNPVVAYEFSWKPEMPKKKTKKIDVPEENNVKSTKKTDFEPDEMIRISKHLMGFND